MHSGNSTLVVNEIFLSLQGESVRVGLPTVFIRLTGCPLRCRYCDTAYAFDEGEVVSISSILNTVKKLDASYVTVTGGEPLAQKKVHILLSSLCDAKYHVSLESSGALDVSFVDRRVMLVMDLKTPASGEETHNHYPNIEHLKKTDQVKFVLCNRHDYEWAKKKMITHQLSRRCEVLFSASHGTLSSTVLANWIVADRLAVRLQIQLHKYLWGDTRGR